MKPSSTNLSYQIPFNLKKYYQLHQNHKAKACKEKIQLKLTFATAACLDLVDLDLCDNTLDKRGIPSLISSGSSPYVTTCVSWYEKGPPNCLSTLSPTGDGVKWPFIFEGKTTPAPLLEWPLVCGKLPLGALSTVRSSTVDLPGLEQIPPIVLMSTNYKSLVIHKFHTKARKLGYLQELRVALASRNSKLEVLEENQKLL